MDAGGRGQDGLTYGSVCSGIEAATVAWQPLGWEPAWFSEVDEFAGAVLANRYAGVPNLGDMTKMHERKEFNETEIDLLVGGTPCQPFSSAGKRLGLRDPCGRLALELAAIAGQRRPRWIVWENVVGALTTDQGDDFRTILEAFGKVGYCCAWRVLDARFFGVPQRRRRLFLVAYLGDWRPAAAALLEPEGLRGDSQAGRKDKGKARPPVQEDAGADRGTGVDVYNFAVTGQVAATLGAHCGTKNGIGPKIMDGRGIRIPTPVECERLQGFPDGYTDIPWPGRGIENRRRKALGNSMAVPVVRWIGQRIAEVEHEMNKRDADREPLQTSRNIAAGPSPTDSGA